MDPITDGNRLCLIYDLILDDGEPVPEPTFRHKNVEQLTEIAEQWKHDAAGPEKLVFEL